MRASPCLFALVAGIAIGTLTDRTKPRPPCPLGEGRLLAADFHLHSSTWSDGALTPIGLVLEAERQGLDAIAITGHDEVGDAKVGRWFSRLVGGPTVLVGQEILAPGHHLIGVGTEEVVDSSLPLAAQIDAIHAQGGVAIAAHPGASFWPGYDAEGLAKLDAAEIAHPSIYVTPELQREFEQFATKGRFAAIGSSDFHGVGRMGLCRTYLLARDLSPDAVLSALRDQRTLVFGRDGRAYGDPRLRSEVERDPSLFARLQADATTDSPTTWLDWVGRACGVCGLFGLVARRRGVRDGRTPPDKRPSVR
jgi:predicted metal-dependent phosphoesterase TrpH